MIRPTLRRLLTLGFGLFLPALLASAKDDTFRRIPVGKNPESVVRGFNGQLHVTLMGASRQQGDGDGALVRVGDDGQVTVLAAGFDDPKGLVFTGDRLITADFDRVWSVDPSGRRHLIAGPEAFPTPPLYLNDVVLEPGGQSVLVTDMGARDRMMAEPGKFWPLDSEQARQIPVLGRVYRVTLDGKVSVVIDHDARMPIPNGLDRLPDGTLRIGEFFLGTLLEWHAGTWRRIGDDYRSIDGLAHDGANRLFATEVFTGRVWEVNAADGRRTLLATLQSAADLIFDAKEAALIVPDSKAGEIVFIPVAR
jgi:sugar lactone lactonase YvrE